MLKSQKILSLLFAAIVFGFAISGTAGAIGTADDSIYQQVPEPAIYQTTGIHVFGIQEKSESRVHLAREIPLFKTANPQDNSFHGLCFERSIQRAAAEYLAESQLIVPGLTLNELLFPFHHFL
ncbi:MAG: hypothetical protein WD016_04445 [Balneolaceae bacterium]